MVYLLFLRITYESFIRMNHCLQIIWNNYETSAVCFEYRPKTTWQFPYLHAGHSEHYCDFQFPPHCRNYRGFRFSPRCENYCFSIFPFSSQQEWLWKNIPRAWYVNFLFVLIGTTDGIHQMYSPIIINRA